MSTIPAWRTPRPQQEAARVGGAGRRAHRSPTASSGATARRRSGTASRSCSSTPARSPGSTRRSGPNSFLARSEPQRRRARRGPHLHLLAATRRTPARPTTGRDPVEMRAHAQGPVRRLHARPHDVRRAVLDGPARLAHLPARRRDHRLAVRRRQHAHHDPHGPGGARPHRRGRRLRAGAALGRAPARRRRGRRRVAVQRRPSTSSTSPRPARSGRTARATAATRCSARSASRCASPR